MVRNVLVFGVSGIGKTTLIREVMSDPDYGGDNKYIFHEYTSDIECDGKPKNTKQLKDFIKQSCTPDIVLFVVERGRILRHDIANWNLLHTVIEKHKTPVIVIVNHCEQNSDGNLDSWCIDNTPTYHKSGIVPTKFVGISFCYGNKFIGDPYSELRCASRKALLSCLSL